LEAAEVIGDGDGDEEAVDAVADAELFFLGLEVDVGALVGDALGDDVGDEADDGGVFIGFGFVGVYGDFEGFEFVFEGACADAVVSDDEFFNAVGGGEVPDEGAGGEGG